MQNTPSPMSSWPPLGCSPASSSSFFSNATATTEIYTLSLHDALPIFNSILNLPARLRATRNCTGTDSAVSRSEEHTSELQSHSDLVCRLLLEKKKRKNLNHGARYN